MDWVYDEKLQYFAHGSDTTSYSFPRCLEDIEAEWAATNPTQSPLSVSDG
jgi:hypothetical protein